MVKKDELESRIGSISKDPPEIDCNHVEVTQEVVYVKLRQSYVVKQKCTNCGSLEKFILEDDDESIEEMDDEEIIDKFGLPPKKRDY